MADISKIKFKGVEYNIKPLMDTEPTTGSTNAVQSGGVKAAIEGVRSEIPAIDSTLSQSGQAADAKAVGDNISTVLAQIPIIDAVPTQGSTNAVSSGGVYEALAGKVDTETGKGLSTNDYSDAEKQKVTDATADLSAMTSATAEDEGKALKAKTVENGKVIEWEFGEAGGGAESKSVTNVIGQAITKFPYVLSVDDFEIGNIHLDQNPWTYSTTSSRVRTKESAYIYLYAGTVIGLSDYTNYEISIGWITDEGVNGHTSAYQSADFTCPVTGRYAFIIRKKPETSAITVEEIFSLLFIQSSVSLKKILEATEDDTGIKSDIAKIKNTIGITNLTENMFDIGDILMSNSGWLYSSRVTRVRTKNGTTIPLKAGDVIGLSSYTDARFYVGWLKADGTYGHNGWNTQDFTCTVDGDYVILLCHLTEKKVNSVAELFDLLFITDNATAIDEINSRISSAESDIAAFDSRISSAEGDISALDTRVEAIEESGSIPVFPQKFGKSELALTWSQGATDSPTNTRRIHTASIDVSGFRAISYSIPSDYQVSVNFYRSDGSRIRNTGWDADGYNYRLCCGARTVTIDLRKSDDATITPSIIDSTFLFYAVGSKIYNYDSGSVYSIYHRGLSDAYPENTKSAFIGAAKEGGKFIETDVRWTSDNVAVLLHDATINRTGRNADGTEISETINIADITYEQALTYDFGIWKGTAYAGEKIVRFDDFCGLCANYGLNPVVEIKVTMTAEQITALYTTALQYGLKGQISWLAQQWQTYLAALVAVDPAVDFYWLTTLDDSHATEAVSKKPEKGRFHMDVGIDYATQLSQSAIDIAIAGGVEVTVWTASKESHFALLSQYHGVTGITTNGGNAQIGMLMASGDM